MPEQKKNWVEQAGWKQKESWIQQDNLIYGGMLAIGLVLLQAFMEQNPRDVPSTVGTISFAAAMPLVGVLIMLNQMQSYHHRMIPAWYLHAAKAIANAGSFTGVVAAFWHVSWVAGVVVLASGTVAIGVHSAVSSRLEPFDPQRGFSDAD